MYISFIKRDGLNIYINEDDIIAYEEKDDCVVVITAFGEYEVLNPINEILNTNNNSKFSEN